MGGGSFVDTNIISNQASHPQHLLLGKQQQNIPFNFIYLGIQTSPQAKSHPIGYFNFFGSFQSIHKFTKKTNKQI